MIKTDFSQAMPDAPSVVHFIGIGGAGMSGIAHLFLDAGITVTGSDLRDTHTVDVLRDAGAVVTIGHDANAIGSADTVVVTGAIGEDNPEYLRARERGVPVVHRAVALAWLTGRHRLVAVAGAHGKTTSTAMVVTALRGLGADPGFVNGGVISSLGVSSMAGKDELFVVEADESDGSFLLYDTAIALITNVDPDHLDHFGSEAAFIDAFVEFAAGASEAVIISADDPGARQVSSRLGGREVITFGTDAEATVRVHSIEPGPTAAFVLAWQGRDYPATLRIPGRHNVLNAAGAFGVLVSLGFDPADSLKALGTFAGTERRFEFRGDVGGVRVFDDFAHHPTEISAALGGARSVVGEGRIIPIFQPHLYSRTERMAAEFAAVFEAQADHTIIVPIYAAREDAKPGVTGRLIAERFADASRVEYLDSWAAAIERAVELAHPGDIVMSMGGGDVYGVVPDLLTALAARKRRSEHDSPGAT
ncbi:UDP-N-acetylmuramate--alanine ligase [Cryobacterium mesophilum]|uniref:UDP-N-acetylmuramate--L-alanine ligase n=1 Tax=Terrimesophilobacter mesophilus TaxID=433647 RepID=A0A4R8VA26_9MICO|nr:UDP-N-acetylmuramate--L-alanine ligase [Terrimesophilobacter mesophilus]MBB5632043.1 UDP-N-acetylmuramate--alanine ligase [Terrimesophilobacter mesophilus]TFB78930.1 UDP-N-acetylmuramate--L-alanine ligase [Terrimesophilobacter mesophilus]